MSENIKKSKIEFIKKSSNNLRGTIPNELSTDSTHFTNEDSHVLKFHDKN